MFSNQIIYSFSTKEAVEEGILVQVDEEELQKSPVKFPVYFTHDCWSRYVEVPDELKERQNKNARLHDVLRMFSIQARNHSGSELVFKFACEIPDSRKFWENEKISFISNLHRNIELKAVITAQDIDDPSPAIFIMLPWED